jgi:predicted transcriptional regulator
MTQPDLDTIFQVLGSKTRRDILANLSSEPMYFNQLSKRIGIGQQAMLRHMRILHTNGFVQPYDEKSDLGAPDRKFYKLDSSFTLSVYSSKDEFEIKHDDLAPSKNKQASKLQNKMSSMAESDIALDFIHDTLTEIDQEIQELETRLHNLREVRQVLLQKTREIAKSQFNRIERKVLYQLVTEEPLSLGSLSNLLDENRSDVRAALDQINTKLEKGIVSKKAEELIV